MKSPKTLSKLYISGYLVTLLMGSLHFGNDLYNLLGYNIGIYSVFEEIFMRMFDWEDDKEKQGILFYYPLVYWTRILTVLIPLSAMIFSLCTVPFVN